MNVRTSAVIAVALFAGCTSSTSTATSTSAVAPTTTTTAVAMTAVTTAATTASTTTSAVAVTTTTIGPDVTKDRPYEVFVPTKYNSAAPMPLVVMLHGYTLTGALQEDYFKLQPLAEERGFLYVHPDGTQAAGDGAHFWNATDACCNFHASNVDDSAYLLSIIEEVQHKYNVDPKRIFLMGHSNGGFMSHRMACDHADKIAAIASLAGAMWNDVSKCSPSSPINVLQIHGTDDELVRYAGGIFAARFPSAEVTTADWAKLEGCDAQPVVQPLTLDLDRELPGAETTSYVYSGCTAGGSATLWSIAGGKHSPHLSDTFSAQVIDYLFAHPKP